MAVLSLKDWKVKHVRKSNPLISGKKVLGKGQFCQVFESNNPDRVFKLTADHFHVEYLLDSYSPKGRFKPVVHEDHGIVAETNLGADVWLLEVERLYPLTRGSDNYRLAKALEYFWESTSFERLPEKSDVAHETLKSVQRLLSDELLEYMAEVNGFTYNFCCKLDIHLKNFMQRTDGTLIFSDPVLDTILLDESKRCRARSVIRAMA
jgi:hypothetical protein